MSAFDGELFDPFTLFPGKEHHCPGRCACPRGFRTQQRLRDMAPDMNPG